jgi:hypothetical protein
VIPASPAGAFCGKLTRIRLAAKTYRHADQTTAETVKETLRKAAEDYRHKGKNLLIY